MGPLKHTHTHTHESCPGIQIQLGDHINNGPDIVGYIIIRSDALLAEILMPGKAGTVFVINVFPLLTKLGVGWGRNGGNS